MMMKRDDIDLSKKEESPESFLNEMNILFLVLQTNRLAASGDGSSHVQRLSTSLLAAVSKATSTQHTHTLPHPR